MIKIPKTIPFHYVENIDLSSIDFNRAIAISVGHGDDIYAWHKDFTEFDLSKDIEKYKEFMKTYGVWRSRKYTWAFALYDTIKLNLAYALTDPHPYVRGWAEFVIRNENE